MDGAVEVFNAMRAVNPKLRITRWRTPFSVPPVESFFGLES